MDPRSKVVRLTAGSVACRQAASRARDGAGSELTQCCDSSRHSCPLYGSSAGEPSVQPRWPMPRPPSVNFCLWRREKNSVRLVESLGLSGIASERCEEITERGAHCHVLLFLLDASRLN